jgi:hypothetical protein
VFATDDVVTVFEQSWTDTLKIEEWTDQTSVEALLQARADEKAAAAVLAAAARANATGVPVTNTATDDTAPCEDKDPKKCPQYQQEIGCGTAFERIDSGTGATISIDVNEECKLTCNMCNNNAERQGQDGEGLVLDDAQTATLQACLSLCELASADAEALAECNGVCDATATTTASSSQSNGGGLSAVASGLVVGLALILV